MKPNPFEIAARFTKAHKLACHLFRHQIHASDIDRIQPGQWITLAKALGLKSPSAETLREVRRMLGEMEAVAA